MSTLWQMQFDTYSHCGDGHFTNSRCLAAVGCRRANLRRTATMPKLTFREALTRPIVLSSYDNSIKRVARYQEALSLAAQGKHKEALVQYRLALANSPKASHAYYNMALSYVALEQFEEAIACYEKALEIDSKFIEAQNNLGVAYVKLQHGDLALKHFHRALRINPNYFESLLNIGMLYFELGNFANAVKAFNKVLAIEATDTMALYHLGLIYAGWKDIDKAKEKAKALEQFDREMAAQLSDEIARHAFT
jgi:tetratricopeptide (TPR) repeat protein